MAAAGAVAPVPGILATGLESVAMRRSVAAAICAAAVLVGAPAPSQAAVQPDVTRISAGNVVVSSGACRYVPIRAWHNGYGLDVDIQPEVWRGNTYVGSTWLMDSNGTGSAKDTYLWCPYLDGIGTFRVGPSQVSWIDWDTFDSGNGIDATSTRFYARYASRLSLSASRSGKYVTLKTGAARYDIGESSWIRWSKPTVRIQRRASATAAWKTVRTVKSDRSGRASVRLYSPNARDWRAVSSTTSRVWGKASVQRRK